MVLNNVKKLCPMCNAPIKWEGNNWRPFCSERCKLIDLGDWAEGKYKIESNDKTEVDDLHDQNKKDDE